MNRRNDKKQKAMPLWLRRTDQVVVASLVVISLLTIGGVWFARGGLQGRAINIDRAPPKRIQFQVDLNEAEWPELAQLPEVGESLARRIVESRSTEGPFIDIDDLLRIKGIGPKTLYRVRPYLVPMAPDEAIVDDRPLGGNG